MLLRIRTFLKRCKGSKNPALRLIYRICLGLLLSFRFLTKAGYRSEIFYGSKYAGDYHQRASFTTMNRYPGLFSICKDFFKDKPTLRILSFGCSTGEEVESLSHYFPEAEILGADINKRSLRVARSRYGNRQKHFVHSLSSEFNEAGNFDIVFCCAVLQSTANRTTADNQVSDWPFHQFESAIVSLDQKLSDGGLLVIDHCDFRFTDTCVAAKYEALPVEHNQITRDRPTYNALNQKISDLSENDRVFVKRTKQD